MMHDMMHYYVARNERQFSCPPPHSSMLYYRARQKSSFDYLFSFNCIFVTQRDMDILAADKTK